MFYTCSMFLLMFSTCSMFPTNNVILLAACFILAACFYLCFLPAACFLLTTKFYSQHVLYVQHVFTYVFYLQHVTLVLLMSLRSFIIIFKRKKFCGIIYQMGEITLMIITSKPLRKHAYSNILNIFHHQKSESFQIKNHISAKTKIVGTR